MLYKCMQAGSSHAGQILMTNNSKQKIITLLSGLVHHNSSPLKLEQSWPDSAYVDICSYVYACIHTRSQIIA